jgi:hypothetical protein
MFSKLAIATVVVIASLSGAMAASTSTKVYVNGKYIGADPDPTIRAQLAPIIACLREGLPQEELGMSRRMPFEHPDHLVAETLIEWPSLETICL